REEGPGALRPQVADEFLQENVEHGAGALRSLSFSALPPDPAPPRAVRASGLRQRRRPRVRRASPPATLEIWSERRRTPRWAARRARPRARASGADRGL